MSPKQRSVVLIASSLVAGLLVPLAVAWACTPQATINAMSPTSGVAGTHVTLSGKAFGEGPVQLRLDSQAGPLLATVAGPSFIAQVTIPKTSAGVHQVVATGHDATGAVAGTASAPFTVTAPPARAAPDRDPSPAPPKPAARVKPMQAVAQAQPPAVPARAPVVVAEQREAPAQARQPVFADSLPKPTRSVAGDTPWERTQAGVDRSPLLLGTSKADERDGGLASALGFGAAVLGVGLVVMFAGFLIAEVRRRRALVRAGRPR